jgi:hypothetical protein
MWGAEAQFHHRLASRPNRFRPPKEHRHPLGRELCGPHFRSGLCEQDTKQSYPCRACNPGRPAHSLWLYRISSRGSSGTSKYQNPQSSPYLVQYWHNLMGKSMVWQRPCTVYVQTGMFGRGTVLWMALSDNDWHIRRRSDPYSRQRWRLVTTTAAALQNVVMNSEMGLTVNMK